MNPTPDDAKPVRIYIDLIADLFHAGDVRVLERARTLGDVLVVGVLSDADVERASHVPIQSLEERVAVVSACRFVDEVVPAAPLAPDEAFLDSLDIDVACLVTDLGVPAREEAFAALLASGRGVAMPDTEGLSTGDLVARIVERGTRPARTARRDSLAKIHAAARATGEDRAVVGALGALAAVALGQPDLMPPRDAALIGWARVIRAAAQERLRILAEAPDSPGDAPAPIGLVRRVAPPDRSLVLIGRQAIGIGFALAGQGTGAVTAVKAGLSAGVDFVEAARDGAPRILACPWNELGYRAPECDVVAVLDEAHGSALLRDRMVLWRLSHRIRDAMLLCAELAPDAEMAFRVRADADRFVHSDPMVRAILHLAGFFDVVDLATAVDGMPRDAEAMPPRRSRFTYRERQSHGTRFRFADGMPAARIEAPEGATILRWYRATKRPAEGVAANDGE